MLLTTTDFVPGKKVKEILGIARGSTIRAKHIGKDIAAGLKSIIGGELGGYTEMINESREEAIKRMEQHAKQLGADAVINVRFMTAEVISGAAEVLAYGTAVKLVR
ncbi:MAG: YbjQ family protein [Nanoarchaeota archaeon]|nr:YbjQ family protein [Nanoarchaeota archaeon]